MLKSLAIALLVTAYVQSPESAPNGTAQAPVRGHGKIQRQRDKDHNLPVITPTEANAAEQAASAPRQREQLTGNDKELAVNITGLPSVALAEKHKSRRDSVLEWGPWVANFLLVIVGGFQALLLWRSWKTVGRQADTMDKQVAEAVKASAEAASISAETLAAIKRQADLMEKQSESIETQTGILKDSVAIARDSAVAAKASADIAIGASLPKLVVEELIAVGAGRHVDSFFQYPSVKITVKNYGQTPAFLKFWCLCFSVEDLPDMPVYEGPAVGIVLKKAVIEPGIPFTLPALSSFHRQHFSEEVAQAVVRRERPFSVYGYICYGDIFGSPLRRLKFCEAVLNVFGGDTVCDWWEGLSPPDYAGTDNYPFREKTEDGGSEAN